MKLKLISVSFSLILFFIGYNAKPIIRRPRQRDGGSVGVERSRRSMGIVFPCLYLLGCAKSITYP
jgi:hypothetical protein